MDARVLSVVPAYASAAFSFTHNPDLRLTLATHGHGEADPTTPTGNEFGDAGLSTLQNISELYHLSIYGLGFTDTGLEDLKKIKNRTRISASRVPRRTG